MYRRNMTIAAALLAAAFPTAAAGAETTTATSTTKAHGLLNAAVQFDRKATTLTAKADVLEARAATLRTEANAATPADQGKLDQAGRLQALAAKFDKAAAAFTARATAFRTRTATRLTRIDDEADAAKPAKLSHGLLNAAVRLRAAAAKATAAAVQLRTEANATTPVDQTKLDRASQLEARAKLQLAIAARHEARAARLAAAAEVQFAD